MTSGENPISFRGYKPAWPTSRAIRLTEIRGGSPRRSSWEEADRCPSTHRRLQVANPTEPLYSPPPRGETADCDGAPRDDRPTKALVAATARAARKPLRRSGVWPRRRTIRSPAWNPLPEGTRAAGGCAIPVFVWTLFWPCPRARRAPSGLGRPSGGPTVRDADRERLLHAPPSSDGRARVSGTITLPGRLARR